ncbi:hypothetical protein AB0I53_00990 [Saccharopolyspora sp. NPDC050389]|uniref:hypothetical protein n=1 Tax=Saccharopolyspora sp. NPDC050389 TaxID=3155516 RepID=UPI0033CAE1E4
MELMKMTLGMDLAKMVEFNPKELNWPDGELNAGLTHLDKDCQDANMRANKKGIMSSAYQVVKNQPVSGVLSGFDSETAKMFMPNKYFDNAFRPAASYHSSSSGSYNYQDAAKVESFWVDFSDAYLGGGVFRNGFLQEEAMCCEIPELANAAGLRWDDKRKGFHTREPAEDAPTPGLYPTPWILRNALRTYDIPPEWKKDNYITKNKLNTTTIESHKRTNAQRVNVLAMAAPLSQSRELTHQLGQALVDDLFNTFVAAFTLARETAKQPVLINSGPIGTGDFHNNRYLVYVLQVLAAQETGVNLALWYYPDAVASEAEKLLGMLKPPWEKTTINYRLNDVRNLPWPTDST